MPTPTHPAPLDQTEALLQALQRSEARIRLIIDSIPALVAYFGNDRTYHYVNRGYHDWFGLDTTQPHRINARQFLGTDTYLRIRPFVMQALRGHSVTFEYEVQTLHQGERIARTTLIPEADESGQFLGCFELTFDITDERLAQSRMARAQKMEALGQLTGGLAHDFNNILTVIQGNLSSLMGQPALQPFVASHLQPAKDAAQRGADLIKELLNFARKQPLKSEVIDLNDALKQSVPWLRGALPETLTLTTQFAPEALRVKLDANQFRDALLNIALNAKDATEGRGRLCIQSAVTQLDEAAALALRLAPGDYARICLEDDGCGMDQATLNRVFEPFFTTKAAGQGTGLGMSMVYGFVQQSAGAIDLRSEPDEGTRLTLFFPLQDVATAPPAPPVSAPRPAPTPSTPPNQGLALLVEDDPDIRRWLRRELIDMGYAVLEAEHADEAMTLLTHAHGIQLLLSDVVMPGTMDGLSLAQHAKHTLGVPHVVLMSGYVPQGTIPDGVPLLHKPFARDELRAQLTAIG